MNPTTNRELQALIMSYVRSIPAATSIEDARYLVFMAKMLTNIAIGAIQDEA